MIRSIGYRYRIYPDKNQIAFLEKQFGICRFVYNQVLSHNITEYKANKTPHSYQSDIAYINELKNQDGYKFIKDGMSQSIMCSVQHTDTAFKKFFKHTSKFPVFHKKKSEQSITIPQHFTVDEENNLLTIPKLKSAIKINIHRPLPKLTSEYVRKSKFKKKDAKPVFVKSNIVSLTISKTATNKYFASVLCEEDIQELPKNNNIVGLDFGIKDLVISSHGEIIANPKYYKEAEKKLKHEQRKY